MARVQVWLRYRSNLVVARTWADKLRDWADDHPGGKLRCEYDCDKLVLLTYFFREKLNEGYLAAI